LKLVTRSSSNNEYDEFDEILTKGG